MHIHFVVGGEKKNMMVAANRPVSCGSGPSATCASIPVLRPWVNWKIRAKPALVIEDEAAADVDRTAAKSEHYGIIGMKEEWNCWAVR